MWFIRKSSRRDERLQIRARLQRGEMLHISFSDEADPGDLDIEGPGEIRLAIRAPREFKAEVVRGSRSTASVTSG